MKVFERCRSKTEGTCLISELVVLKWLANFIKVPLSRCAAIFSQCRLWCVGVLVSKLVHTMYPSLRKTGNSGIKHYRFFVVHPQKR